MYRLSVSNFKTRTLEKDFNTLLRNISNFSQTDMGSRNYKNWVITIWLSHTGQLIKLVQLVYTFPKVTTNDLK